MEIKKLDETDAELLELAIELRERFNCYPREIIVPSCRSRSKLK
jgi:hypothetical protein